MVSYFIRRILLVPPTLFLITLIVFSISRMMPGGPMERILQQAAMADSEGGGGSTTRGANALGEKEIEELEERFGLDKPWFIGYFQWLGLAPKESYLTKKEFGGDPGEAIGGAGGDPNKEVEVVLKGTSETALVKREGNKILSVTLSDGTPIKEKGWSYRLENEETRQERYRKRNRLSAEEEAPGYKPRVVLYKTRFSGLFQGDLGRSILYGDSVLEIILSRIPIAAYFGILTALITYGISLPLGVLKAIKHRTPTDSITSILIFFGYSIPGFALGAVLVIWLGARLDFFPISGFVSPDFETLSFPEKVKNLVHHTFLPLLCYVVGGFAYLTMMMKNNLMDNLASDYVKTAISRGASFNRAVFGHAFKNSLIPIATTLGQLITLFVSGSMLVESVFDIQGFGLLQYQSVVGRDFPVVMGTLTISALLVLVGNILSDFIVATLDPRIKFS